jgi:hypothetical protein
MRRLYYSSGYVDVADKTCKAALRYARALADAGKSDIVTIPVVTAGGSRASAHLLLGPASQLFSTPVTDASQDPVDKEAIREMERLTRELQPSRPTWSDEMLDVGDLDFPVFEYDLGTEEGSSAVGRSGVSQTLRWVFRELKALCRCETPDHGPGS